RCTNTEVDAGTEGNVFLICAAGLESKRVHKFGWIGVRGTEKQPDLLTRPEGHPRRDLHLFVDVPREHVQRGVEAKAFLNRGCCLLRRFEETSWVPTLLQDSPYCIAGLVYGGLVPGIQ